MNELLDFIFNKIILNGKFTATVIDSKEHDTIFIVIAIDLLSWRGSFYIPLEKTDNAQANGFENVVMVGELP